MSITSLWIKHTFWRNFQQRFSSSVCFGSYYILCKIQKLTNVWVFWWFLDQSWEYITDKKKKGNYCSGNAILQKRLGEYDISSTIQNLKKSANLCSILKTKYHKIGIFVETRCFDNDLLDFAFKNVSFDFSYIFDKYFQVQFWRLQTVTCTTNYALGWLLVRIMTKSQIR